MRSTKNRPRVPGIYERHGRSCPWKIAECLCSPTFQAAAWSRRDRRRIRKSFKTFSAARAWQRDALARGEMRAPTKTTVRQAGEEWLAGARSGGIRNRSGDIYKPSTLRGYSRALRDHVYPALGSARVSEVRRRDVQNLAEAILATGADPSTVRNALMPLRVVFRRAILRQEITVNPTMGIELPAVRGRRDRVASPAEAAELIAVLPTPHLRAVWATAFYAGLRAGELQGLLWSDVDLAAGLIRVEASWDREGGRIPTKSHSGRRCVPIFAALRVHLVEHQLACRWSHGFAFGRAAETVFDPSTIADRARRTWKTAELEPFTLHEARHTCASLMIAAGVNIKAISTYMGHASITITLDRYGHLLPGSEGEATTLFDQFLARHHV